MDRSRFRCIVWYVSLAGMTAFISPVVSGNDAKLRVYVNRLKKIADPQPLLNDQPDFVHPVRETTRFEAPVLIDDEGADLSVRAWRYSYNARGIIEIPNRLRSDRTALIVVHPWGIDDGQGWKTPEPAGVAFQCTPIKNKVYQRHVRLVVNPLVQSLRKHVGVVMYSLPGNEDAVRRKLYRSVRSETTAAARKAGQIELRKTLQSFDYRGKTVASKITLKNDGPETAAYFRQFPGLDAGDRFNNRGFWKLPIPVVAGLKTSLSDIVIYDAEGYEVLRKFLKKQAIRHVLLCGYNTDMCVCSTTAGYENLRKDFNVFLIGDATLATFPANKTPAIATNAAVSRASLSLLITQVSWIKPVRRSQE